MEYGHDRVCPECRSRHGAAAKACECGYVFTLPEEDPAPPLHFFLAALFFGLVFVVSAMIAQKKGMVYMPIGSLLFMSASAALGIRSWIYFFLKKRKNAKQAINASKK